MTAQYWAGPVLQSVLPIVELSRHVRTNTDAVDAVARWLAYEELAFPAGPIGGPVDLGSDPDRIIDMTLLATCLNFAFTDFDSGVVWHARSRGRSWSDAEGLYVRLDQALDEGVPLFDGDALATLSRADLERILRGNIELPLLDERVAIINQVGATLVERYDGAFHRFVADCAPAMFAGGDGLLERLAEEFPRFADVSNYHGHPVAFYKLGQLALWSLHVALAPAGGWRLHDLEAMTAFADYIVPVALEVMGIIEYTHDLEQRIAERVPIERDSDEEIEIRAHTLYATALLTDALNVRRPADRQVVVPQVDYRLWSSYHATFRPHHLTTTVMY